MNEWPEQLLIIAVIAALCTATAWQVGRINWMMIQLSFADEQTKVFTEMSAQAIEALKKQPPDVQAAVEFLEYTHGYYPSGTKQAHDTTLDRIVERSRSSAESRIIETLRAATGLITVTRQRIGFANCEIPIELVAARRKPSGKMTTTTKCHPLSPLQPSVRAEPYTWEGAALHPSATKLVS